MSNGSNGSNGSSASDVHGAAVSRKERIRFDALNLQVGGKLQLVATRDIKQVHQFSHLIGYLKDEYLLLQIPNDSATLFPIHEGEKLTVRLFSGVRVCWFDTIVVRIFPHPYSFMHVSFPDEVYGTSLRTAVRVKVNIPAKVRLSGSSPVGDELDVGLQDLSIAGARVKATSEIPESAELIDLDFSISLQGGAFAVGVSTKAKIQTRSAQIQPDPANPYVYTYGVQFQDLEVTHRLALQNLIYETLAADWRSQV